MASCSWAVPVVEHLSSKDGVEAEASDETVQDELVIDFLQGGVDSGQGAEQIVEDGERRQLSRASLVVDGEDLWQFARNTQCASPSLQRFHLRGAHHRVGHDQRVHGTAHRGQERSCLCTSLRVYQDQHADDHVLDGDQARLAIRAEGKSIADVVRQGDDKTRGF